MFLVACSGEASVLQAVDGPEREMKDPNILLILGEGGPSGGMFVKAAATYQKEHGGDSYEVHSGDEFVAAMRDFYQRRGPIDQLVYFGHGNHVGLYVNQAPNVNGALYANDPILNDLYVSASIFELPREIFREGGHILFNGCNVADGYPEKRTLAQDFANYFDIIVDAPRGPTEFSRTPDVVDPIPNSNFLDADFDGEVYMVPTYLEKAFVTVEPQPRTDVFVDVREGQSFEEAVYGLFERGLNLDYGENLNEFDPYAVITYGEAREFCRVALGDVEKCRMEGAEDERIRNLRALQMLVDAYGVDLKWSNPWYNSYIYWAGQEGLLTEDFVQKKWFTRAEMAEMSWGFIEAGLTNS